jgi:hypothetical protein
MHIVRQRPKKGKRWPSRQHTLPVKAANHFALVLYRNPAKGASVQTAVAKARQALYVEHPESWCVPMVYGRSHQHHQVNLMQPEPERSELTDTLHRSYAL